MERKVIQETIIPARYARVFEITEGQVLRIYVVEDKQVGDCVFFNLHNLKETFNVAQTWSLAVNLETGTAYSYKHFYSKPPWVNLMFTVLEDTVRNHSGNMASMCNPRALELRGVKSQVRTCHGSLTEALEPYGLTGGDVPDVFNVFMVSELDVDGTFTRKAPTAMEDDYIDLRAEMDILAAISACPSETIANDYRPKPLGVKIFEREA